MDDDSIKACKYLAMSVQDCTATGNPVENENAVIAGAVALARSHLEANARIRELEGIIEGYVMRRISQ